MPWELTLAIRCVDATDHSARCLLYTGWPKKVSHYQMIKNRIKSYQSLSMRLDLFVKLKHGSSTMILFVIFRYSMRDLLYDLNDYA